MNFKKKKSLGQHFLSSSAIAARIADAASLSDEDTVFEIGPGTGILTNELLSRAEKVIAIEKDDRLITPLSEKFKKEIASKKLTLIHADVLDFDISKYFNKRNFIVVANIPYYITGVLIRKLLVSKTQPKRMVLLVQKEVAERIARTKKESLLSLSVKVYGTPRYVATIKRGSFTPQPNVDSAILRIEDISKKHFSKIKEGAFFELLHHGFAHKRKLLIGNLTGTFGKERVTNAFTETGIPLNARAEELSLEKWLNLSPSVCSTYEVEHTIFHRRPAPKTLPSKNGST